MYILALTLGLLLSETPAKTYEVEVVENVPYYQGPDASKTRHKLDLFIPKGRENYPVVVFFHGGAWRHGSKNFLGIYANFGKYLARHGIGMAAPNYRLSPAVQHPEHIKDVARAVAWTYRHIREYHGDPNLLFISGHSAGAHLAALLAVNDKYLKAEGLDAGTIQGVVPMSGVYHIPEESWVFDSAFTKKAEVRKDASPLDLIHPGLPPFLIFYADNDLPYCGKETSEEFCKALKDKQCSARAIEVTQRNHMSLVVNASRESDPVAEACRAFIEDRCKQCKTASEKK